MSEVLGKPIVSVGTTNTIVNNLKFSVFSDKITGLSPVISIEQKTVNKSPRSTVGTTTEIYDFLRLLFSRCSDAYSYITDKKMISYNLDTLVNFIKETFYQKKIILLAP